MAIQFEKNAACTSTRRLNVHIEQCFPWYGMMHLQKNELAACYLFKSYVAFEIARGISFHVHPDWYMAGLGVYGRDSILSGMRKVAWNLEHKTYF